MPAKKGSSVSSLFTDSARGVETTRSVTWWKVANLASELNDTRKANVAALGPQQCLITNSTTDVELYHLVDRRSSLAVIRKLQFAWGRQFSPNNRFNKLYLTPDFRAYFDNNRWALIPEPDLIARVEAKMRAELAVRLADGNDRAWPDFRSEEWFPIQRDQPFHYIFVPLTLTQGYVAIFRRSRDSVPPAHMIYDPPEYQGFPILSSHVHPYMVIMNAAPKLKKHSDLFDQAHSAELRASIEFIYDTWMSSADSTVSESSAPPPDLGTGSSAPSCRSTRLRPNHSSNSRHSRIHSQHPGRRQRGMVDQSHGNPEGGSLTNNLGGHGTTSYEVDSDSAEFFGLDAEFGGSDEEFDASSGTSRSPLSISVPDESTMTFDHPLSPHINQSSPKCNGHSAKLGNALTHIDPTVRLPKDLVDWINGANTAREDNNLSAIHDLPEQLEHYAAERVRTPYERDWHEWTSDFAPWYVLLPNRRERGVLSSNDWVEVVKGQSLTGRAS